MTPPAATDDGGEGTHPESSGMKSRRRRLGPPPEAITGAFSRKTDFVSYVISGLLIGLVLDWVLGTGPWLTVGWTLLAFGYGYRQLWHTAGEVAEEMERHSHGA